MKCIKCLKILNLNVYKMNKKVIVSNDQEVTQTERNFHPKTEVRNHPTFTNGYFHVYKENIS